MVRTPGIEDVFKSLFRRITPLGINFDRNLVNVCVNVNYNELIKVTPPEEEPTCERCFTTILTEEELNRLFAALISEGEGELASLQAICEFMAANSQDPEDRQTVSEGLAFYGGIAEISVEKLNRILICLEGVYGVDFPPIPTRG